MFSLVFTLAFAVGANADASDANSVAETRRVEVSPGFETESGEYEIDHLIIAPDGSAKIESTREFGTSKQEFAAVISVGSQVTVVFASKQYSKPYRHSIAGPFEVVGGDGPFQVAAHSDVRPPIAIQSNAERIVAVERRLELPLPDGVLPDDDRQDEARAKSRPGFWSVYVPSQLRRDRETEQQTFENTLMGHTYRMTASAIGYQPKKVEVVSGAETLDVKLAAIEPLVVTVKSPTGMPLSGVRLAVREQPESDIRVFYSLDIERELAATTDEAGVAKVSKMYGHKTYDMYVDGGDFGRAIVKSVRPGQRSNVVLATDPPLTVTIKNIPASDKEPSKGIQIIANERLSREYAITWITHGPFDVDGNEVTFTLPAPLGDKIDFQPLGSTQWKRKLIVNARGRAATIDLSNPTEEVYVAPEFAGPNRTITLRFRTPDGSPPPAAGYSYLAPEAAKPGEFAVSRRGPTDNEKSGRSYKSMTFIESSAGEWSMTFPADEQVRVDLDRVWVDGYVIDAELNQTVRPGETDVILDIPLLPAVDYQLDVDDFAKGELDTSRIPFSSVGYDRVGNNAQWIWLSNDKLMPDFIRVPASRKSLLLINDEPNVFVRYLDGTPGTINVDWEFLKRTTIQAYTEDGDLLSSRIDGFVLPDSGIKTPVNPYYNSEETGDLPNGSSIPATQAVMNLEANGPVWVVLQGYGADTAKQVVKLTPGEHHKVTMPSGRELWVDLLNPDGADWRFRGSSRGQLFYDDDSGIEIEIGSSGFANRFVGVPLDKELRYSFYVRDIGWAEVQLSPGQESVIGVVVEFGDADEPIRLSSRTSGSTGTRQKNRDFFNKKRDQK